MLRNLNALVSLTGHISLSLVFALFFVFVLLGSAKFSCLFGYFYELDLFLEEHVEEMRSVSILIQKFLEG